MSEQKTTAETQPELAFDPSSVSLLSIANYDFKEVAEVRPVDLVNAAYRWQVEGFDYEDKEVKDYDGVGDAKVKQFVGKFKLKILDILVAKQPIDSETKAKLIGKHFTHNVKKNIKSEADIETWFGMLKAFSMDIGVEGEFSLRALKGGSATGKIFDAEINLIKNRDDASADPFPQLNVKRVKKAA